MFLQQQLTLIKFNANKLAKLWRPECDWERSGRNLISVLFSNVGVCPHPFNLILMPCEVFTLKVALQRSQFKTPQRCFEALWLFRLNLHLQITPLLHWSHLNALFLRNLKHRDSSSHYNILVNCITLKYFCTETKNLVEWFYIADSCQNLDFKLRSKSSWQNRAVTECTDNSSKTRMSKESYFIALHWQELGFIQLNCSQSLFYFVPQESYIQASAK